jgi:hypothetical protein
MIGFFIGTVCLLGLIAVVRRGRRWGGACGHGAWRGGHGYGGFGGHRGGPRFFLRRLFAELGTSPSQEKVIVSAVEELQGTLSAMRGELGATRANLADALRAPSFSAESMGDIFSRHDDALRKAREAVTGALARVHDVLDESQRTTLAAFIERGLRRGGWGGPYRTMAI